jgi:type II secretory pathway pseudopilin PulG
MRGFSLIEILISSVILIIIFAGVFFVLNAGDQSWNAGTGSLDLQQQVRQAMDGMSKELRQARHGSIIIEPDARSINFTVPINITTNPPTYSSVINYYLNATSSQLERLHPLNTAPKILANDISDLSFCCQGGSGCSDCQNSTLLQVQVNGTKTVRQRVLTPFNLTQQVRLRN